MTASSATGRVPRIAPWVPRLARLLDSRFRVPGTSIRFGLDPILGLIPGLGDTVTAAMGMLMLVEVVRLRLSPMLALRMLANLGIDWMLGLIPGLDIVLDTAFRSHERNLRLLQEALARRGGTPRQ